MKQEDFFESAGWQAEPPLAERMRPSTADEFVGQQQVMAPEKLIGRLLRHGRLQSLILWGPPGCGKTTLARLIARDTEAHLINLSAVTAGVKDVRAAVDEARQQQSMYRKRTVLFLDEIHRFNKAQQDALLPFVEDGTVILVGATTENPSFEVNSALTSRCQVLVLNRLSNQALDELLVRAEELQGRKLPLDRDAREALTDMADGDGRFLLNIAEELLALEGDLTINREELAGVVQRRVPVYDKADEGHYNLISALHKSVRGSDPDASLYWLARMLVAGEDPLYVMRRVVRMAIEDIGMADPAALTQAIAAKDTYDFLGSPEGELAIAQAVVYCATAPKSNAAYNAYKGAMRSAKESGSLTPPKIILNAPTKMMKEMGYGAGYDYDHDAPDAFSGQNYFPDEMGRQNYYRPVERGFEREITKRLEYWSKLRQKRQE